MLTCWQPGLFNEYWSLKGENPAMKPDKAPIMLRWSFPAASPGGIVKVAEWMQQNADKNLEETLL